MVRILSKHQILSMTLLISKYLIPFKKQPSLKSPGEVVKIVFTLAFPGAAAVFKSC